MTFIAISLLVLTTLSAISVGESTPVQDACTAGTRHYTPPHTLLLALRPPSPGLTLQDSPCVCRLLSPRPLQLSLLLSAPLHPTGDDSGQLSISLGNNTLHSTSLEEGKTLLNVSQCQHSEDASYGMAESTSSSTMPPTIASSCLNLTLTLRHTGNMSRLLLFQISPLFHQEQPASTEPPTHTAGNLTVECQDATWKRVTPSSIDVVSSSPATTSNTEPVQMNNPITAIIVVTALTLLLTLLLLLLLLFRRNWMQRSWVQEDINKKQVTLESPPAKEGSISEGGKREGRKKKAPGPNVQSIISNLSSDVFLDEDHVTGPHVTGTPPRGRCRISGGRDLQGSPASPGTGRHPKASAGSNCSHLGKAGDGRRPSTDPRDRPRVPSPFPQHRTPALPPSPAPPTPTVEVNEEWYGNLDVEEAIQSRSGSLDNVYEDPEEARPSAAKAAIKPSVKVVPLKSARAEQERKATADQGKELPKILEAPAVTAAPPNPGHGVQADTTQQPRSRPRTPQSPADNLESAPQPGLQKSCSREDAKTSSAEHLLLTAPTAGAVPSVQTEEGGQGKTPTPSRSRDVSPAVPAKTRSRNKSQDSLDSNAGLGLLFPDSGRTSKASLASQAETLEMAQVENKEDEEEDVYQNYCVQKQASLQEEAKKEAGRKEEAKAAEAKKEEAKKEEAGSSPKSSPSTVVLIDNELYESSAPALKSGSSSSTTDNPFALAMRNQLFSLSSDSGQPSAPGSALPTANHTGTTTPETPQSPVRSDGCVLEDNILYESSASLFASK